MRRGPAAVLLALLLATTAGGIASTADGAQQVPAPEAAQVDITPPTIVWGDCDFYDPPVECATVRLPLDYDDPDGPTTRIGMLRRPATGVRIGTLFVNPGGPGGTASDFASFAGRLIGPGIQRRFDVVGIDPRGVGLSGFAWCRVSAFGVAYPITRVQVNRRIAADRRFNEGCAARRSRIVDHSSTADVARDMDVIRQALGEEQLSYYGISYGSLLGQTYAAMFPDRVRAMIVDGVLHPIQWTRGRDRTVPMTYRLGSGYGAYEALTSVLVECDRVGRRRCSIAGHAYETWLSAVRAARQGRLRVNGDRVSTQNLVGNALFSLYDPVFVRFLIDFLDEARETVAGRGDADVSARAVSAWRQLELIRAEREKIGPYGVDDGADRRGSAGSFRIGVLFQSVVCGDSLNPHRPRRWAGTSRLADRRQPWFGRLWTWESSVCADWPGRAGEDAYRGPWRTQTSYPLLVVGNTHDPATPISGARAANRLFEGSVLLMLDAWGHGAIANGDCIRNKMAGYLIQRTLPAPGTVCKAESRPY
jgi:pimeloyl-ACP methyl ester carboxylesterase